MYRPGRSVLRSGTRLLWGILSLGSTVTLIGTLIPGDSLVAAPLTQDSDSTPNQSLQQLLVQESQGKSVDRVAALAKLRSADYEQLGTPDKDRSLAAVHWHSGQLSHQQRWISATELNVELLDPTIAAYYKKRGDKLLDLDGHRTLARWCRSQGLQSQASAHWYEVLESDRSDVEARRSLGHVLVGSRWFSPEEMSVVAARSKTATESLKQWMPKVREWVVALDGNDTKKRLKAIQQLKSLKDPKVVVALDVAIGQVSAATAMHFIQVIGRFQTREACISLAGIAISDPSSEIGVAAIEALKGYPLGFYVPDMLDLMSTEYELRDQVVTRGNGEMVLQLVQTREMRNRIEADQLDKLLAVDRTGRSTAPVFEYRDWREVRSEDLRSTQQTVTNNVAQSIVQKESQRTTAEAQAAIEKSNDSIRSFQRQVATVLRSITKQKLSDDPKAWWAWWERHEESYSVGPKNVESSYREDRNNPVFENERVFAVAVFDSEMYECLVAGTLIQTDTGLKPVDGLRAGDQVVSQDIVSGEISLRSVLRTTLRPPAPIRELTLNNRETIRSTLGHLWWVNGHGWVKTKDLETGMLLRTLEGSAVIDGLKPVEEAETFNLVIDEDRTYFVGTSRVLSFDASNPVPTFQRVPGVPAEILRDQ